MSYEFVTTELDGRLARVTFSRGDGRNPLSVQLMEELRDTARALNDIADLTCVILQGEGAFSAGADLKQKAEESAAPPTVMQRRQANRLGPDMCNAWAAIEAYTIGAIEKFCLGGGSAIACALDYRIMGETAFMRLPEVPLGMPMTWHTIPRLVQQIGPARTKQYVILGEKIMADQALEWGLCEEVAPDGETGKAAEAFAARVLNLPPLPVKMSKTAIDQAAYALSTATTFMDRDQILVAQGTQDMQEAVLAFLEKRDPAFKGN